MILLVLGCTGHGYKGDSFYIELYKSRRSDFVKAKRINQRLMNEEFCYHFRIIYTEKFLLGQLCDSIWKVPEVPRSTDLLTNTEVEFYRKFMHENKIQFVNIYPDSTVLRFRNYQNIDLRPQVIMLHRRVKSTRGYLIDSLTYFVSPLN